MQAVAARAEVLADDERGLAAERRLTLAAEQATARQLARLLTVLAD